MRGNFQRKVGALAYLLFKVTSLSIDCLRTAVTNTHTHTHTHTHRRQETCSHRAGQGARDADAAHRTCRTKSGGQGQRTNTCRRHGFAAWCVCVCVCLSLSSLSLSLSLSVCTHTHTHTHTHTGRERQASRRAVELEDELQAKAAREAEMQVSFGSVLGLFSLCISSLFDTKKCWRRFGNCGTRNTG